MNLVKLHQENCTETILNKINISHIFEFSKQCKKEKEIFDYYLFNKTNNEKRINDGIR